MFYGETKTKGDLLDSLDQAPVKSKLAGKNTLDYTLEDGTRKIRLHDTDILTFLPNGKMIINTGGFNTKTTRARLNDFLPRGYAVGTEKGVIRLRTPRDVYPFLETITINKNGSARADSNPAGLVKLLDRYMRGWKKADPKTLLDNAGGDPWIFHSGRDKVSQDVMLDWIENDYVFAKLYFMAYEFSDMTRFGAEYHYQSALSAGKFNGYEIGKIRRYCRACLGLES